QDLDGAERAFEHAIFLNPSFEQAFYNLGLTQQRLGKIELSISNFQRALELNPDAPETINNMGIAFAHCEKYDVAAACFQRALELRADYADAHGNLATVLAKQRRYDESIAHYRAAFRYDSTRENFLSGLLRQLQMTCEWGDVDELSQQVIARVEHSLHDDSSSPIAPFDFLGIPVVTQPAQQKKCAERWTRGLSASAPTIRFAQRPRHRKERITVGYLSSDFREHVIAYLVAGMFEQHDRTRFRIIGYSYGRDDGSEIRSRISQSVESFVDIHKHTPSEAAQTIWQDQVDILVDLTGYTSSARSDILIPRPAPIQTSFLGYAGSMGAPFVDYLIADECVAPASEQSQFSERLVHLPGCYYVNDRTESLLRDCNAALNRREHGLNDHDFVFSCFNNHYKITRQMFSAWMDILKQIPNGVLWLLEACDASSRNLRLEAQKLGVSPDRLVFAPRRTLREHMVRNQLADLALDTLPYNGHTTTADALRFGCPVLTIEGQTFSSRVASSMLRTVGLEDLIVTNTQEYIQRAVSLARTPRLLASLREQLSQNLARSTLFDPRDFAKKLERAYELMFENYVAGNDPQPIYSAIGE
ncbi:MAG: tetratricopeptide repeat protein, partial [Pirellula sp.]